MNNFEVVIGIEIHIELNTKTKMFSCAANDFSAEHNTLASVVDLAYPGTLPVINKAAVEKGVKLAKALNMSLDHELHFDRKNYFYPDLPKGFQITQHERPMARNGFIPVHDQHIPIARFHLEEDTAKTINDGDKILLDYNRAGVPLIEIVTDPVMHTASEAVNYVSAIRSLVSALDISDAKMEEGSLRVDVNISLRPHGETKLGTKVEIKNLNSLGNVEKSINDEIAKQSQALIKGEKITMATKRFDEQTQQTITMRVKTGQADYKYFAEPNIPPIALDKKWVQTITIKELPWEREKRYMSDGIEKQYVTKLMSDFARANFFDAIVYKDRASAAKIFFAEVVQIANERNCSIDALGIKAHDIAAMLLRLEEGIISGKHVKEIVPSLASTGQSTDDIIAQKGLRQISDEKLLQTMIAKIVDDNRDFIAQNKDRPERIAKNLLGLLMKATSGQANPVLASKILASILEA